jgi:hypothetical protein
MAGVSRLDQASRASGAASCTKGRGACPAALLSPFGAIMHWARLRYPVSNPPRSASLRPFALTQWAVGAHHGPPSTFPRSDCCCSRCHVPLITKLVLVDCDVFSDALNQRVSSSKGSDQQGVRVDGKAARRRGLPVTDRSRPVHADKLRGLIRSARQLARGGTVEP